MKVLYIHMAALGDGLMVSPALAHLKQRWPECELHVLARTHVVQYFRSLPFVDHVVPFADQRWLNRKKLHLLPGALPGIARLFTLLRREHYDVCLQWRGQLMDSVMSWWTSAPIRIAAVHDFHRKALLPVERVPFLMTDLVRIEDASAHVIEAMAAPVLRLLEKESRATTDSRWRMHFPIGENDRKRAEEFLRENRLDRGKFACLSFSSKTDANVWPIERFAEVADHLAEVHGLRVLLDGLPIHRDREKAIAGAMRTSPVRSAGDLNLGEIAAVIAQSRIVVCFNSAPMHLASTFQVPCVVIGGRDGAATRPFGVPFEVVTKNPFFPRRHPVRKEWPKLIAMVTANEINAAVDRVLVEAKDLVENR